MLMEKADPGPGNLQRRALLSAFRGHSCLGITPRGDLRSGSPTIVASGGQISGPSRAGTHPSLPALTHAMDLPLPLDYATIERILPHRYPFLLVDRIIELEVDKRIVGIKNISLNDPYLSHATAGGAAALPPT